MHVAITSIRQKVVDKPLWAGLILFIVNISLNMLDITASYNSCIPIYKQVYLYSYRTICYTLR